MRKLAQLLNEMQRAGVIRAHALFGATAQMRYTEPVATFHADVLVATADQDRLNQLSDIYAFCASKGYHLEGEAIRVGAWPAHFMPACSPLTEEALDQAVTVDYEGIAVRVVSADHLVVIALSVGRAKDLTRVLALLESGSITRESIRALAERHGLGPAWQRFESRFLND